LLKQYLIYVVRWLILAIPGAWLLQFINQFIPTFYAMLVSQTLLGMTVYFIDKRIFGIGGRE
jgi:hypothetical protein